MKAGAVVHIGGEPCAQRQVGGEAGVEGVALVVIDGSVVGAEVAGGIGGMAAGEAADDVAALLGDLVRIGEMELAEVRQLRRAESHLPGANQCAIDGDGEVHVGFADVGVIEEVVHAIFEGVDVEHPAFPRNLDAELMFFVALGGQRSEGVLALLRLLT